MEVIRAYWSMPLVSRLTLMEQVRVLALVYALVFVSVVVLHLFLPGEGAGALFLHAAQIAFGYLFWFAVLGGLLTAAMAAGLVRWLRVWHVWMLSALCYLLGFFLASFDDALTITLHHDVDEPRSWFHFLRLLPVWLVVTWVFTGTYVGRSRREEIARLARLNQRLAGRHAADPEPAGARQRLQIAVGRTAIDLPVDTLSHVSVDDHYCYLYHHRDGGLRKEAIGMPLSELLPLLPDSFLQIHRSHAVNLPAVAALQRHGRSYRLRLEGVDELLPVSRQRIGAVLPRLEGRDSG